MSSLSCRPWWLPIFRFGPKRKIRADDAKLGGHFSMGHGKPFHRTFATRPCLAKPHVQAGHLAQLAPGVGTIFFEFIFGCFGTAFWRWQYPCSVCKHDSSLASILLQPQEAPTPSQDHAWYFELPWPLGLAGRWLAESRNYNTPMRTLSALVGKNHIAAFFSHILLATLQEWLELELQRPPLCLELYRDDRCTLILLAVKSINQAFRVCFSAGVWLRAAEAAEAAKCGLLSLRAYRLLADKSLQRNEPRYPLHSKYHMLCHAWRNLQQAIQRGCIYIENPLTDSCQQDESFVGIISRYSRRVSPKQTIWRTLDIYLTSLWSRWREQVA